LKGCKLTSKSMYLKTQIYLLSLTLILFTFQGCTLVTLTQETIEKVKTTSTSAYPDGVKPDSIRNIKDYIVNENDFVIVAESPYKTLYKIRNESNMGRLSVLDDLIDYCEDLEGKVQLGKQFTASIVMDFDGSDLEFSAMEGYLKTHRQRGYRGWMKCSETSDDFEVLRKSRTKYFMIAHKNEQLQGYALQWYIDYFDLDDMDLNEFNIGIWSYSALVQFAGVCYYNKGTALINNRYSDNKKMELNAYFLQQANPTSSQKAFFMSQGDFYCENPDMPEKSFELEISYSKKYRKLLYTKRQ